MQPDASPQKYTLEKVDGRHEGLKSAQVTLDTQKTEISTLKTHLEVEKRRTEEFRYSAQRKINYLQERLHDYRNSYGPNARGYYSSPSGFNEGYRYNGSCFAADGGTVFPYNAIALSVKAVSVYNAKQQELLNELQAKNKWQTNEINKLSSVVIEQQPEFKRLERENEALRTVLRQSNKWAQKQSARITKANTFFASIKAEANSAFNYNGTFLGFDAAQRALRSILSITTKPDTDASSNSV